MQQNRRNQNQREQAGTVQRHCYFCTRNYTDIDYKDTETLRRFTSSYAKIVPRKRSGVCSGHQRQLSNAIKRARIMAMLPFTNL